MAKKRRNLCDTYRLSGAIKTQEPSPCLTSGEELYRRFRDGDEAAFEELVALYRDSLTRYIYRFVNDARDAEELMIDTFAELAVDTKFKGRSSLKTYLFSIGRNTTLKYIKRYKRKDRVPYTDIPDNAAKSDYLPDMDFIREEQLVQLHNALRTLKQDYREVLHLIYFEDMSYSDAGATMCKTVKQIENLTRRAKASLKGKLESEAGGL